MRRIILLLCSNFQVVMLCLQRLSWPPQPSFLRLPLQALTGLQVLRDKQDSRTVLEPEEMAALVEPQDLASHQVQTAATAALAALVALAQQEVASLLLVVLAEKVETAPMVLLMVPLPLVDKMVARLLIIAIRVRLIWELRVQVVLQGLKVLQGMVAAVALEAQVVMLSVMQPVLPLVLRVLLVGLVGLVG
jgi:hypothetical protein